MTTQTPTAADAAASRPLPNGRSRGRARRVRRLLSATAVLAAALPGAAQAATIVAEGDTLVYNGTTAAPSWLTINDSWPEGRLRFEDSSTTIDAVPPSCTLVAPDVADCDIPARVQVRFGDGNDRFSTGDGYALAVAVEVHGNGGDDTLYGEPYRPLSELLHGGPGNDVLRGFGGDDQLDGGDGNDVVDGGAGADSVLGGEGDDTLSGDDQAAPGADQIYGGGGNDLLKDYVEHGTDVHPPADVSLDGIANDGRPGEGDDVRGIERMVAYVSGSFVLTDGAEDWQVWSNMNGGESTVLAGGGSDRIVGQDAVETIDGGAGDDYLEGGKGHDTIIGGSGRDTIFGDETTSTCKPEWPESCVRYGSDTIDARDGEVDQVDCGAGTDRVYADAVDVVAANCEVVDRGGPAGPGPGTGQPGPGRAQGGGGGPAADGNGTGTRARVTVVGRQRLATALRRGLRVKLTGAKPGTARIVAREGRRVVGSARTRVSRAGTATVRVRFTKAAVRRLRGQRRVKLTIAGAGVRATVTLRR